MEEKSKTTALSQEEKYAKALLTTAFSQKRDKVIAAYNKGAHTYRTNIPLYNALHDLVDYFGPVVTNATTLGGNLSLYLETDTSSVSEVKGIPSARITASLNAFILRIEGDVEADVMNTSTTVMKNSNYKFQINGGANEKMTPIIAALRESRFGDLRTTIADWVGSIDASDDASQNNVELISSRVYPIWRLFDDEVGAAVKEYVLATYADPTGVLSKL